MGYHFTLQEWREPEAFAYRPVPKGNRSTAWKRTIHLAETMEPRRVTGANSRFPGTELVSSLCGFEHPEAYTATSACETIEQQVEDINFQLMLEGTLCSTCEKAKDGHARAKRLTR